MTCGDTQIEASNLRVAMRKLDEVPHNSTGNGYQQQFSVRAVNISPHMLKLGKPSVNKHSMYGFTMTVDY